MSSEFANDSIDNNTASTEIINVKDIGKRYVLGGLERQHDTFRDMLMGVLNSPLQRFKKIRQGIDQTNTNDKSHFWALKNINFSIKPGEIVGVIGHNGAGKSTLLKILTRVTAPTEGEIRMTGRVASLLEVGTGFHPELTGRENIYLNGAILGMGRAEIKEKFTEIVAFAEIERFLDTPVKRYSSGMYVRLAFAVAAHLEADILLVDEVLAVGDQAFQKRCIGKLNEVGKQGRTVFFVSHNLSTVARLCHRILVLDQGKLKFDGNTHDAIAFYSQQLSSIGSLGNEDYTGELFPTIRYESFAVNGQSMQQGIYVNPLKPISITVEGCSECDMQGFKATMSVRHNGQRLLSQYDCDSPKALKKGEFFIRYEIPAYLLMPGEYSFSLGGYCADNSQWLWTREYRFVVANRWAPDFDSTSTVVGMINIREFGVREQN